MRSDTELIDGLERAVRHGACPAIVNDDNGHWAVVTEGFQAVPLTEDPQDVSTTFWIAKDQWRASIRDAIDGFLDECYENVPQMSESDG